MTTPLTDGEKKALARIRENLIVRLAFCVGLGAGGTLEAVLPIPAVTVLLVGMCAVLLSFLLAIVGVWRAIGPQ